MKIRNSISVEIAVCYGGRRDDGRSRTPAFLSHRPASLSGSAPALSKSLQQTPIHTAAAAGRSLSDALRGLDFSRSRSAAGRASRIAPGVGAGECSRLHDCVSLSATFGRPSHRPRGRGDGASAARDAQKRTAASPRGGRCDGLGAGSGQHVLCAAHASSRAKTAAVAALAEMGSGGGPGSAVSVVADRATRPVERLCQFASGCRSRFRANAHRAGAGRLRVRQRAEPHLHPATTRGAQCDPSQAWKENLEYSWGARRNAAGISATALSAPRSDRDPVQFGETQALGSCAGPLAAHAKASSSAARTEFQSVPPEASLTFLEDVNRATRVLILIFNWVTVR